MLWHATQVMGADVVLNYKEQDVVAEIKRLTRGGVDVAIEALGTGPTFENALRCIRPDGTVSSLGVYSGDLRLPLDAFAAGLGDHTVVTSLCPDTKKMRFVKRAAQGPRGPVRWS